jgi:hypothetical protein
MPVCETRHLTTAAEAAVDHAAHAGLLAAPSVIGGSLFELQLCGLHRVRLHELGRVAEPLPTFGFVVWAFHPWAALRRVSQIEGSRLHSVPITVMDWGSGATKVAAVLADPPVVELAAADDAAGESFAAGGEAGAPRRAGRKPVPDELYAVKLREYVRATGGVVPSAREVARLLGIGQDRARRLVTALGTAQETTYPETRMVGPAGQLVLASVVGRYDLVIGGYGQLG